ncbi:MAG: dCTP deaminase domain-containing protein [Thalassobaculum sp.]
MAFWSGETLKEKLPHLVQPYDEAAIDCAAYTLHVGSEIYVSPDRRVSDPTRHTKKRLATNEGFTIPAGQFAFLTTAERISVPDNAIAFISIKARLKFGGLINISGFHVDPGYQGELLFSVMNAGPKPLHLQQGQPLFLIWYADLDQATEEKKRDTGFIGIDPVLVNGISGEILSLQSLSDEQRDLEQRLSRQLQQQETTISNLKILVGIFVTASAGLIVGLAGWWLRSLLGGTPP